MLNKSALELAADLREGQLTAVELTEAVLARIEELNPKMNAFVNVDREGALEEARRVDEDRAAGKELPPYAGVPVALKDNMCQHGKPTSAGSRMLDGWLAPYDATVVRKVKEARLPIVGHTNMDEFAMGSSTETSYFGPTHNPWGENLTPGGSGGGSAAAVAAHLVPWALGSDTGGSIRQPGALTGTVGVKPTYGAVSRYGVIALASSLDQVGPVARTVADAAALQEIISGFDPADAMSANQPAAAVLEAAAAGAELGDLTGVRIGVVKELTGDGVSEGVLSVFTDTVNKLKEKGAEIVEVSCPHLDYAMATYYVIMSAEASSNLAKFEGVRYGNRVEPTEGPVTSETMMKATRGAGFGKEVKRRLILGTLALSAGFYDEWFETAQQARTLIKQDLDKALESADVLFAPTAPTTAFHFGEQIDDPITMYLNDMTTTPANLGGNPAMSVPAGLADGLPVGVQLVAGVHADATMYKIAAAVEKIADPAVRECPVFGEEN